MIDRTPPRTAIAICLLAALLTVGITGRTPAQSSGSSTGSSDLDSPGIPTEVVVRAVAHDAKVIGSNVGGARIRIEAVRSGRVLAEGVQEGDTGDTERIIQKPHPRGGTVYGTEGAAAFRTTLNLDRPTLVDVTAFGPLGSDPPHYRASRRMLLVPGQDVVGEGIVLTLQGFTVEILSPERGLLAATDPEGEVGVVSVRARVTMLCGCGTEPDGMWDANRYQIEGRLLQNGEPVARSALEFAGTMSTYESSLRAPAPGTYTLQILAMDAEQGNFGIAERTVTIRSD
jgi:hypothetical protein